jgi:hypothetical protein
MAQSGFVYHLTLIACCFLAYEKHMRRERYPFKTYLPYIAKGKCTHQTFDIQVYLKKIICPIQQPQLRMFVFHVRQSPKICNLAI